MKNIHKALSTITPLLIFLAATSGCNRIMTRTNTSVPPANAIVLFDGTDFSHWRGEDGQAVPWRLINGAMEVVPGKGGIITKQKFQDFKLHLEFKIPPPPQRKEGQSHGNSGVYIQRRYEVQILDSYGQEPKNTGCGALYKTRPPDRNLCKRPGEWQSYDITFRAAGFEGRGKNLKKLKNARISVIHNGVLIHDDVEIPNKTGKGRPEGPEPGPVLLQDHESTVQFRNIWIVPLN